MLPVTRLRSCAASTVCSTSSHRSIGHRASAARTPALDLAETDKDYTVTLDLPGVAKEQVQVSIDGRVVKVEAKAQSEDEKKDGDRIVYRERSASQFARSFKLPVELDQAASSAKLDHGVLTLTLAKRVPNGAAQLTIN